MSADKTKKSDTKKSDSGGSASKSDSGSSSSETGSSAAKSSGAGKASARPISYFSSVSTDEYRDGWNAVFGNGGAKPSRANGKAKTAAVKRKPAPKRPNGGLEVSLSARDLKKEEREVLMAAFRRKAKTRRIDLDRRAKNGKLSLDLTCRIDKI